MRKYDEGLCTVWKCYRLAPYRYLLYILKTAPTLDWTREDWEARWYLSMLGWLPNSLTYKNCRAGTYSSSTVFIRCYVWRLQLLCWECLIESKSIWYVCKGRQVIVVWLVAPYKMDLSEFAILGLTIAVCKCDSLKYYKLMTKFDKFYYYYHIW